jgi:hypothetical protein
MSLSNGVSEQFIKTGILPEGTSRLEMSVMDTDEHYRGFAARCLRMAEFCERAQPAASLRCC